MTHSSSSRHGFDFNVGEWIVTNRRLKRRGVDCDEWEVFEGYERAQQVLGGLCNIDEIDFPTRGTKGMTIRLYRPEADEWSIWWINSSDGVMQPPVHGKFAGTRGAFRGDDLDGDKPIKVVFDWQVDDPQRPQWSQAFSYDNGKTWETNWVMEFRRA